MERTVTVWQNIKVIMDEKGYTYQSLADKSGYDRATIMKWVRNKSLPNAYALYDLAVSLGVTMERLVNG